MIKKFPLLFALICSILSAQEEKSHFLLDYADQHVEVVMQRPSAERAPMLLFLHGASGGISEEWFKHWVDKGYAVAAISMPGYGNSTGKRDFCGPSTMGSLHVAIEVIKEKLEISEFGMISFGQGTFASLLLASQRNDIQCVVGTNGGYDLFRHKVPGDILMNTLVSNNYDIDIEDDEALAARSPILHIATINTPVFLIHRKGNPVITESEVIDFYQAMLKAGKECHLSLKENTPDLDPQKITSEEILNETESWVDHQMGF